jgi:hypothetical protein
MENKTELEKKLFEYILFLLGLLNVYDKSMALISESIARIHGIYEWGNENFKDWKAKDKQDEMFEFLNKEFSWNFHKPENDEEVFGKK